MLRSMSGYGAGKILMVGALHHGRTQDGNDLQELREALAFLFGKGLVRHMNAHARPPGIQAASHGLMAHTLASAALIEQGRMTFPEAARLLYRTGYYLYERAQYMEAESLLQQGLTIYERMLGPEHPDTAPCLTALALLYSKQGIPGKYEQAESLLQRVLAIHQRAFGPEHPEMAHSLDNLALLYERQGKYEQAELLLQQALAICEQVLGPNHSDTANGLDSLAWLYGKQGKYEQAATLYQRALAIYDLLLEPDHLGTATSLNGLAQVYERQGCFTSGRLRSASEYWGPTTLLR